MKQGFVKVASATPRIRVADPAYNAQVICAQAKEAAEHGAKIVVYPELCITGYTCNDLFLQNLLLEKAKEALLTIVEETGQLEALFLVGLPVEKDGRLYNVAAVLYRGRILGMIPKKNIPMYAEFYEGRYFTPGEETVAEYRLGKQVIPFGSNLLFRCEELPELILGCEICEDLWVAEPPSTSHALMGATVIANLSASNETVSKDDYRTLLVKASSARLLCGYIYTSAGEGESTQDLVFGGHDLIAENGTLLAQSTRFSTGILYGDLDVLKISSERRRMGTFGKRPLKPYLTVPFSMELTKTTLSRKFAPHPFVPEDAAERNRRCEDILSIQAYGLKKRYEHIGCKTAVLGISGGLDSTLALLVMARAFDRMGMPREQIHCVTMPCFGTTDRTYQNACKLSSCLGAKLTEVNIKEAVNIHFRDIGHDPEIHDVTYENSQARERTQILMDTANKEGGVLVGTGDLSELALGWATYNGDHMSMYGVNASVPKTLVRHLVRYYADTCGDAELQEVLMDILDTPVSPELLPPKDGKIAQKTEDLVGPYELHDFYLYYMLRAGFTPDKIYRLACLTFEGIYDKETILKWLKTFYRRFFAQQFKRSCLPDGPKVGSVALSPRGDLRMPSDASARIWQEVLEKIEI